MLLCFDTYQRAVIAANVVVDLVFQVNSSLDIVADKQGRTSTVFVSRAPFVDYLRKNDLHYCTACEQKTCFSGGKI